MEVLIEVTSFIGYFITQNTFSAAHTNPSLYFSAQLTASLCKLSFPQLLVHSVV